MSKLCNNSDDSERRAGCVFAETFRDSEQVVLNGGSIDGTPTINHGATFNGTTDGIEYTLSGNEYNSNEISIVHEFTPHFNYDDNTQRYLFDSGDALGNNRFRVYIMDNANENVMAVELNGTAIASIATTTYGDYWLQNERNVLVIVGDAANDLTNVWLNGTQILTDDATAWDSAGNAVVRQEIGRSEDGSLDYDGVVHSFKVFQGLLTAQDAINYYNNSQFDFENRASIYLPMGMAQHDVTNNRTLDLAGGAHATLGAGDGGTTTPTKLTKHGYDFDGGDYLTGTATGKFNSANISIVCEFSPDFATDDNNTRALFDTSSGSEYLAYKLNNAGSNTLDIYLGNTKIESIAEATYSPYWYQNSKNVLIITGDSTNNLTNVWLNGNQILTDDTTAWTVDNPASFWIGSLYTGASNFDGKIHSFAVYPFLLSNVQREQILINSNIRINNV